MDEETLAILADAAMLDGTADLLSDLTALAEQIENVASSRKAEEAAAEGPVMLKNRAADELRGDESADAPLTKGEADGISLLIGSERYAEPYIAVPRVV